jgi:serine/threonine protein kinase
VRLDLLQKADLPVTLGRYRLVGLLGEGGMARVFAAEMVGELGFRRPAAVKVVLASSPDRSRELQEQLAQEARIGGLLNHPNVVQTLDCGQLDGFPYIAMELVEGLTLSQLVKVGGPLPPGAVLDLGEQACAGLHHAHTAMHEGRPLNVIHRDVKPSNLLIRRDGVVKLVDFGIAKASIGDVQMTATGLTKGTPSYMSPEQLEAHELDPRSDLFALGSVIYYALTGRLLFDGGSITEVMMRIATVQTTLERQGAFDLVDRLAPGLGDVFRRLMQPHPHLRHPHASALGSELGAVRRALSASGPSLADLVTRRELLLEKDDPETPGPTRAFTASDGGTSPSASDLPAPETLSEPPTPGPTRAHLAAGPPETTDTAWMLDEPPRRKTRPRAAPPPPTQIAEGWQQRKRGTSLGLVVLGVLAGAILAGLGWFALADRGGGDHAVAQAEDLPAWLPPIDDGAAATGSTPGSATKPKQPIAARTPAPRATPRPRATPTPKPPRSATPTPTPKLEPGHVVGEPPTATPTPTPTPSPARQEALERVAEAAPTLSMKHRAVTRAVVGTRVKLAVELTGPEDAEVVAFVGPPDGPHKKITFSHRGGGRYEGEFDVDSTLAAGAVYWLVASHPGTAPNRVMRGSRFEPLRITVY